MITTEHKDICNMQFEEFKELLMNSELKLFHCGMAYDSDLLYPVVKKIAGYVYLHSFAPPGDIFAKLTELDIDNLQNLVDLFHSPLPDSIYERDVDLINKNNLNIVTLIQIFLAGEGDAELKQDKDELLLFVDILSNFLKVEKAHRMKFGIALRENYSFICIDKIIFLSRI